MTICRNLSIAMSYFQISIDIVSTNVYNAFIDTVSAIKAA